MLSDDTLDALPISEQVCYCQGRIGESAPFFVLAFSLVSAKRLSWLGVPIFDESFDFQRWNPCWVGHTVQTTEIENGGGVTQSRQHSDYHFWVCYTNWSVAKNSACIFAAYVLLLLLKIRSVYIHKLLYHTLFWLQLCGVLQAWFFYVKCFSSILLYCVYFRFVSLFLIGQFLLIWIQACRFDWHQSITRLTAAKNNVRISC